MEPPTATTTTTIGKVLTTNTQPTTTMANGSVKKGKNIRTTAVNINKVKTTPAPVTATTTTKDTSSSSSSNSSSSSAVISNEKPKGKVISDSHPSMRKKADVEVSKLVGSSSSAIERKEERKERMKEKERKKKIKDKMGDHSMWVYNRVNDMRVYLRVVQFSVFKLEKK